MPMATRSRVVKCCGSHSFILQKRELSLMEAAAAAACIFCLISVDAPLSARVCKCRVFWMLRVWFRAASFLAPVVSESTHSLMCPVSWTRADITRSNCSVSWLETKGSKRYLTSRSSSRQKSFTTMEHLTCKLGLFLFRVYFCVRRVSTVSLTGAVPV